MKTIEEVIKLIEEYKEYYGDCLIPCSYTTEDGTRLGCIVNSIRSGKRKISPHEKKILNSLGFVWKIRESSLHFEEIIRLIKEYKKQHGDCLISCSYTTEDGIRLGMILSNIRNGVRKTSADEKEMLNSLGFVWKIRESSLSFEEVIRFLKEYKEQYGDCLVPTLYTTKDGIRLGRIVSRIRNGVRKTSAYEKAMLNSLGFVWKAKRGRKI